MKVKHYSLALKVEKIHELPSEYVRHNVEAGKVAAYLIGDKPVEYLIAIMLNGQNRIKGVVTLSQGGMTGLSLTIRDVFRPVLVAHAYAFVLAHNHPSGDPTPSREDEEFTRRVHAASKFIEIPCVDHVVVTADGSYRSIEV